eukprot:m.113573 g.113573  ORF g.113573 m.113573 type:complete len:250 (+) comp9137_c0_seq4:1134-1883(+)
MESSGADAANAAQAPADARTSGCNASARDPQATENAAEASGPAHALAQGAIVPAELPADVRRGASARRPRVLVGVTGSVAAIKLPELVQLLQADYEVAVVCTEHSKHFFDAAAIAVACTLHTDADEWSTWRGRGDPVLHIQLRAWADALVIAPLDANTLAKMAAGMCDNLLTCVVRAWDLAKPLLFCPAMNTHMWDHPATAPQIAQLAAWGYIQVPPIAKLLACGDTGMGAMAAVDTIAAAVRSRLPPR